MKRVTVTLPDAVVKEIDRWETNRSRFVLVATERELELRRRQELGRSLQNPHPESSQVAEAGFEEWGRQGELDHDDDVLVNPEQGFAVTWAPGRGWSKETT